MDSVMYYHPCIVNRTAPGRVCPLPGDGEPPLAARPAPAPHLLPRRIPGPRLLGPGETGNQSEHGIWPRDPVLLSDWPGRPEAGGAVWPAPEEDRQEELPRALGSRQLSSFSGRRSYRHDIRYGVIGRKTENHAMRILFPFFSPATWKVIARFPLEFFTFEQ